MHLSEIKDIHVADLLIMASSLNIEGASRLRKHDIIFAILRKKAEGGDTIYGGGVLEVLPDGFGFLRSPDTSYLASHDDIYVSPSQIRRFNLQTGDTVDGEIRMPKESEKYFALVRVDKVDGSDPEVNKHKILFENLTPLFPSRHLNLEHEVKKNNYEDGLTGRIIDLIAPIGAGQER